MALLAFSMHTPVLDIAWEAGRDHPSDRLSRNYRELHALHEPGEPVAYQLPYRSWIRVFRNSGFVVEDLLELRPPTDAKSSYRDDADRDWAQRWPMEHIWRVRRAAGIDRR